MQYNDCIKQGLDGEFPLKVILCGNVQNTETEKVGVVSIVYVTQERILAEKRIQELISNNPDNYYMVYSVPLDTDLTTLTHYPSIAISKKDLE